LRVHGKPLQFHPIPRNLLSLIEEVFSCNHPLSQASHGLRNNL
jgi:hypothetical protein